MILWSHHCIGSKGTAILLDGWILPIGWVASGRVCDQRGYYPSKFWLPSTENFSDQLWSALHSNAAFALTRTWSICADLLVIHILCLGSWDTVHCMVRVYRCVYWGYRQIYLHFPPRNYNSQSAEVVEQGPKRHQPWPFGQLQTVNQSFSQSISKSVNQLVSHSFIQSVSQSVRQFKNSVRFRKSQILDH